MLLASISHLKSRISVIWSSSSYSPRVSLSSLSLCTYQKRSIQDSMEIDCDHDRDIKSRTRIISFCILPLLVILPPIYPFISAEPIQHSTGTDFLGNLIVIILAGGRLDTSSFPMSDCPVASLVSVHPGEFFCNLVSLPPSAQPHI
jgi:hypothetical protein